MKTRFTKLLSALLVAMLMLSPVAMMEEIAPVATEESVSATEETTATTEDSTTEESTTVTEEPAPEADESAQAENTDPENDPENDSENASEQESTSPADEDEPVYAEVEDQVDEVVSEAVDTIIAEADSMELEEINGEGLSIVGDEDEVSEPPSFNGGDVLIETTFTDANFRAYIASNFDEDHDGYLSADEINNVDDIDLNECTVTSLSGLEVFVGLRWLILWQIKGLGTLDLTKLPWLEGVSACECELSQVIIPENSRISDLHLERNCLTELDLTNCSQEYKNKITKANGSYWQNNAEVVYFGYFEYDESGELWYNTVLTLDSDVKILGVTSPLEPIPSLPLDEEHFPDKNLRQNLKDRYDLDKNDKLSPRERSEVYEIDLHQFSGDENNPYVIDPDTQDPAGLGVTSLKGIENFPWLRSLSVFCNPIGEIDVDLSVFKELIDLECWNCGLKKLDVTQNRELSVLICRDNELTELNVNNNPNLEYLFASSNNLTELNVSHNPNLRELECSFNKLKKLNVSKNPKLQGLWLIDNNVTELDISSCPILVEKTDRAKTTPVYFGENNSYISYPFTITETWEDENGKQHTEERESALECDATVVIKGLIDSTPKPQPAPAPAPATPATAPATPAAPAAPAAPAPIVIPAVKKAAKATITAAPGATAQLDLGGATGKKFKSSNKKVATVDNAGVVTVKKGGKTKITFKVGKKKRTVTLTIKDSTIPTSVSLAPVNTAVKKGDSVTLTPVIPDNTNTTFKWTSSNKKVAKVDKTGKVTFKKKGKVTITCKAKRGGKKAKIKFTVTNP